MQSSPCKTVAKAGGSDNPDAAFRALVLSELKNLAEQQASLHRLAESHHRELLHELAEHRRLLMPDPALLAILATNAGEDATLTKCDVTSGAEPRTEAGVAESTDPSRCAPREKRKVLRPQFGRATTSFSVKNSDLQLTLRGRLAEFFRGPHFELLMGATIMVNMMVLFAELQIRGSTKIKYDLDLASDPGYWYEAEVYFGWAESFFTLAYTIELLVRIGVFGVAYFYDVISSVDAVIVFVSTFQVFILQHVTPDGDTGPNLMFARILKIFRITRVVKMFKYMTQLRELRILLTTLAISAWSLCWSMCLMAVFVLTSAIMMFQLVVDIMEDESQGMDMRQWVYTNFGTPARASYTMFVCTFSSGWVPIADYMIYEVSEHFAIYWITYIIMVNFAVVRVVAAIFLKQTMQVAALDAEREALEKVKHQKKYAKILHQIFMKADASGDGVINTQEFDKMIVDPEIVDMFAKMDIEVPEIRMLFHVLSEDDGETDYEEFLEGAVKMQRSTRCIDTIEIQHMLTTIKRTVLSTHSTQSDLHRRLNAFAGRLDRLDQILARFVATNGSRWGLRKAAAGHTTPSLEATSFSS